MGSRDIGVEQRQHLAGETCEDLSGAVFEAGVERPPEAILVEVFGFDARASGRWS
ncbi:MAG: hypothetical protein AAFV53_31270 [Myxococcota bacterium]